MRDKERILMVIITRIIPGLTSCMRNKEEYVHSCMLEPSRLKPGDLVMANTTITPNPFVVGFVNEVKDDCVVIREIGSKRLCEYYNESFTIINKECLGYEILEGIQYKIYQKVLKAFSEYTDYSTRFRSIEFSGDVCTVTSRMMFENEKKGEVSSIYDQVTSVSDIGNRGAGVGGSEHLHRIGGHSAFRYLGFSAGKRSDK